MSNALTAAAPNEDRGRADLRPSIARWMAGPTILLLAVALILGGGRWELPRPGAFAIVAPSTNHVGAITIRLDDRTGMVRGLAHRDPSSVRPTGAIVADADPTILLVSWIVGRCDGDSSLTLTAAGERMRLSISTSESWAAFGVPQCGGIRTLEGYPRAVALTLRQPVDPALVVLRHQR